MQLQYFILLSSIITFAIHASEEQKSITALLAKQRTKRARIIIGDNSITSAITAHKKSEIVKTCSKDTCNSTCSKKIVDQNLEW